jgi:hypothetical protein
MIKTFAPALVAATDISVPEFIAGAMQAVTGNDDRDALKACLKVDDVITNACETVLNDAQQGDALHVMTDLHEVWKIIYP